MALVSPQGELRPRRDSTLPHPLVAHPNPCKPELRRRRAADANHPQGPRAPFGPAAPHVPALPRGPCVSCPGSNEPSSRPLGAGLGHRALRLPPSPPCPGRRSPPWCPPRCPALSAPAGCFPELGLAQPPGPAGHVAKLVPALRLPRLLSTAVSCGESTMGQPQGTHPGEAPAPPALSAV